MMRNNTRLHHPTAPPTKPNPLKTPKKILPKSVTHREKLKRMEINTTSDSKTIHHLTTGKNKITN